MQLNNPKVACISFSAMKSMQAFQKGTLLWEPCSGGASSRWLVSVARSEGSQTREGSLKLKSEGSVGRRVRMSRNAIYREDNRGNNAKSRENTLGLLVGSNRVHCKYM